MGLTESEAYLHLRTNKMKPNCKIMEEIDLLPMTSGNKHFIWQSDCIAKASEFLIIRVLKL